MQQQRREREVRRQQEREQRRREQEEKKRLEELEKRRKEEEERRRAEEEKRRVEREQEYIRRQLEEEQRHLEILQQQLLQEQAMLLEYRWREMEEHRQAERLQRQLQQEQAYLLSLQHDHRRQQQQQQQQQLQQQERNKQNYHTPDPKSHYEPTERPREIDDRYRKNNQSSPEAQSKQGSKVLDPPVPSRSESFSNGNSETVQPSLQKPMESQVQWSHLASLKNNVPPVSRSHSFSDPSPKFVHHHLRSQDPYPPSRSEVLNQSSDSKSEVPDPTQKSWARSDSDEVPPRVPVRTTSRSPVLSRRDSPLQNTGQQNNQAGQRNSTSNIEPRLLWERVEKLVPRPGSGSSSGSSNSSSQPGSHPGSQSGSGERFRMRSSSKSEGSPSQRNETAAKKTEEKKEVFRPCKPAGEVDLTALAKELRAVEDVRPPHKVTDYSSSSEESGTTDEEEDDMEQEGSTVDTKRASHHESNGFAGRIHLLPDLLQQSHSSSTSSTSSSPSSSQPTPTMSPQTPQDKLTTNETQSASNTLQKHKSSSSFTPFIDPRLLQISPSSGTTVTSVVGFSSEAMRSEAMRQDPTRKGSVVNVNPTNTRPQSDTPEIRKYKKRFNSEILCKKNKLRVYYLSWLRNKILHNDPEVEKKQGWTTVGDLEGCVHYKVVKYERIKFLVIALKSSVEVYAWAPKPYHKFMAFKIQCSIQPHAIIILPNTDGMELLVCYEDEGVYVNTYGRITKDVVLQWGEMPTSVAYIRSNQIMGWGEKAIEIRSVETGHLDGVFMHKRAQRLKFLCERNDKVFFASVRSGGSSQVYFMTLGRTSLLSW
ncbi:hypothetical protein Chor_000693 [Crotalus horridus]